MNKIINVIILGFFALFVISSCREKKDTIPTNCADIHWKYTGEKGPSHWKDLCIGYSDCGGQTQSPINITNVQNDSSLSAITFNYHETKAEIENNGHTVEFVCDPGSKLTIGGTEYELLQFHYHGLSEHEVDGKHYPLEIHFVNKATATNYAVIGVFIEEGAENPLFSIFLSHFPHEEGTYEDHTEIDLSSLFPENKSYYNYNGSLTTPPCSEVVNWYILKNTVTASAAQISDFQSILHNNYRPIQSLNGRKISAFNE